jgi:hypothetical protein
MSRLNDSFPPRTRPPLPAADHATLWPIFYFNLWLNAALLAGLVFLPRGAWIAWGVWASVLALVAFVVGAQHVLIHDLLVTFNYRERLGMGLFVFAIFLSPGMFRGVRVIPDGILWTTPAMLLIAVTPSLTRRLLALTLCGAWLAALRINDTGEVLLLLVFITQWLLALGLTHVAYLAEVHELRGLWPAARLVRSVLVTAFPAALAGGLVWMVWPRRGLVGWGLPEEPGQDAPAQLAATLNADQMLELAKSGIILSALMMFTLGVLYLWRRWLLKRRKAVAMKDLLPGQKASLEYAAEPPAAPRPVLDGLRGQVVGLWGHWARAMGREGTERRPGETADEFARRVADEAEDAAPQPAALAAMTGLLDRAHYSAGNIDHDDVESMREIVQGELERQKERRQSQMRKSE